MNAPRFATTAAQREIDAAQVEMLDGEGLGFDAGELCVCSYPVALCDCARPVPSMNRGPALMRPADASKGER